MNGDQNMDLYGRDLITTQDWSIDELVATMKLAGKLKEMRKKGKLPPKVLDKKFFHGFLGSFDEDKRGI